MVADKQQLVVQNINDRVHLQHISVVGTGDATQRASPAAAERQAQKRGEGNSQIFDPPARKLLYEAYLESDAVQNDRVL